MSLVRFKDTFFHVLNLCEIGCPGTPHSGTGLQGSPDPGPMVLMSERTVSLTLSVFSKSVCWEVGWPKVLYNLRRGFCTEGQRCLQQPRNLVGQGVVSEGARDLGETSWALWALREFCT